MSRCQDEATLQALLAEAETAEAGFEAAVKAAGYHDKWTLYRLDAFGESWPVTVREEHDRLQAALQRLLHCPLRPERSAWQDALIDDKIKPRRCKCSSKAR